MSLIFHRVATNPPPPVLPGSGLRPIPRQHHGREHAAHHDHGHHVNEFDDSFDDRFDDRFARQRRPGAGAGGFGRQGQGDDLDLSIGNIAAAGERCIDKVNN